MAELRNLSAVLPTGVVVQGFLVKRLSFAVLTISAVFCSDQPQAHLVATGIMLAAGLVLGIAWLLRPRIELDLMSTGLLAFLAAMLISLPVAMYNGTSFFNWSLRGFAPLAFLAVFFAVPRECQFVEDVLLVAVAAWAAIVIGELAPDYAVLPFDRWTFHSRELVIPYNLVGTALLLFSRNASPLVRFALLSVVLVLTLGGLFRSHVILAAAMLLCFVPFAYFAKIDRRHVAAVVGSVLVAAAVFASLNAFARTRERPAESIVIYGNNRSPANIDMPLNAAGDNARLLEAKYAIEKFLESPIVGKGLSYPVPSSLIFAGQEAYLAKLEAMAGKKYPFVYYTHNFPAYVAMTMGLLGLAALAIFAVGASRRIWAGWPRSAGPGAALISIGAFSFVGATYSLPQFGIIVASLAAMLSVQSATKQ